MKVIIDRCAGKDYWYRDKIGSEYEVEYAYEMGKFVYAVVSEPGYYIEPSDVRMPGLLDAPIFEQFAKKLGSDRIILDALPCCGCGEKPELSGTEKGETFFCNQCGVSVTGIDYPDAITMWNRANMTIEYLFEFAKEYFKI